VAAEPVRNFSGAACVAGDLTAIKKFGKWQLGPVAYGSSDLTHPIARDLSAHLWGASSELTTVHPNVFYNLDHGYYLRSSAIMQFNTYSHTDFGVMVFRLRAAPPPAASRVGSRPGKDQSAGVLVTKQLRQSTVGSILPHAADKHGPVRETVSNAHARAAPVRPSVCLRAGRGTTRVGGNGHPQGQ
jgi:hypothetical protein